MTHTVVSSDKKEVVIGFDRPFCIIGERINPTGRKRLAAEMAEGNFSTVELDAVARVAWCERNGDPLPGTPGAWMGLSVLAEVQRGMARVLTPADPGLSQRGS